VRGEGLVQLERRLLSGAGGGWSPLDSGADIFAYDFKIEACTFVRLY